MQTLVPLTNAIRELEDMQVALTLLRTCAGACRIIYLLRTVPNTLVLEAAAMFDDLVETCLRDMIGGSLSLDIFRELQLPFNKAAPCFGIWLTCAKDIALSAFLASLGLFRGVHVFMLQDAIHSGLNGEPYAIEAYDDWRVRANQDADLSWDVIMSTRCPSQRELSKRVHTATQKQLPVGDQRTRNPLLDKLRANLINESNGKYN